jgi:hypothetical protein
VDLDRLTRLAPVQQRFGPTLPQLLAPRLDRLPTFARRAVAVVVVIVAAVVVALILRSHDPVYSHGGPSELRFSTTYPRTLTRAAPPPGSLLQLEQHDAEGGLVASFRITPVRLPAYAGEISGLWPVYAWNYMQRMRASLGPHAAFREYDDGRTRIIKTPGYQFSYTRQIGNAAYFGRVVFITRDLQGDRRGLVLSMLMTEAAMRKATHPASPAPDQVGTVGVLFEPLERFRFR